MLLSRGADIQAQTIDGWQPLHSAARWNQAEVVSLLLHNGAGINSQTRGGQTALHLAASEPDSRETLETLLTNCYIDVNIQNATGEIPSDICRRTSKHFHLFQIHDPNVNCLKWCLVQLVTYHYVFILKLRSGPSLKEEFWSFFYQTTLFQINGSEIIWFWPKSSIKQLPKNTKSTPEWRKKLQKLT